MKRIIYILTIFVLIFSSCKKEKKNVVPPKQSFNEVEFFAKIDPSKIQNINQIIAGFTTPIEMAAFVKDNHIPFNKKYLTNPSFSENYDTNLKKALALGIISADLGYLNVYKKTAMMIDYLIAIKRLADDLNVSQYFDFQTLKYLVLHSDNIDTLRFLTTRSFYDIDDYFRRTNRSYLSVLSVTGVWIETFYLITQVAKDNPQYDLKDQICGQKDIFFQLYEILKVYKGHPFFDYLISKFKKLKDSFEPVVIKEIHKEKKIVVVDGNEVIYPDIETEIIADSTTYQNIISSTEYVRNEILKIQ